MICAPWQLESAEWSLSSHCETVPMWTSNYCDGISASSGWKAFNCSSVFYEEGKWIDEPPLPKENLRLISSLSLLCRPSFPCCLDSSGLQQQQQPWKEEIRSKEVTAFLSVCCDLSQGATNGFLGCLEADNCWLHCFAELWGIVVRLWVSIVPEQPRVFAAFVGQPAVSYRMCHFPPKCQFFGMGGVIRH